MQLDQLDSNANKSLWLYFIGEEGEVISASPSSP